MQYEKIQNKKRTYLELVPNRNNESFVFRKFYDTEIYDYRHIHNEIEIIYVFKGFGSRNIGDTITEIDEGDICLIDSNVPHHYILKPKRDQKLVECWVIQFPKSFLGADFFKYHESSGISALLISQYKGYSFSEKANAQIKKQFVKISKAKGIDRLTAFLHMLDHMSKPGNFTPIKGSSDDNKSEKIYGGERLKAIKLFLQHNFAKDISLDQLSLKFGLSKSAFCNLFKKHFYSTFSDYLNSLRINKAAQLLIESDLPVVDICYRSGFKNLSYFNRKFKENLNQTPRQYRNQLSENAIIYKPGIEK